MLPKTSVFKIIQNHKFRLESCQKGDRFMNKGFSQWKIPQFGFTKVALNVTFVTNFVLNYIKIGAET